MTERKRRKGIFSKGHLLRETGQVVETKSERRKRLQREYKRNYMRRKRQDPVFLAQQRERIRKLRQDPEFRAKENAYMREYRRRKRPVIRAQAREYYRRRKENAEKTE